jgi:uncharacterized membrane protein YkvA (DUF1232 family)
MKFIKRIGMVLKIHRFLPFLLDFFQSDQISDKKKILYTGLIIGYLFFPFDLITDFIPGVGYLDDLSVLLFIFQWMIKTAPRELKLKHHL